MGLHPQGHAAALWGAVLVGMAMEAVVLLAFRGALAAVRPQGRTRARVTLCSTKNLVQQEPPATKGVCTMRGPVPVDGWDDSGKKSRSARNLSYTASWRYIPRDMPPPIGGL